jgi:hypothetical protein
MQSRFRLEIEDGPLQPGTAGELEGEMKKIIMAVMVLVIMSVFLGGCFIGFEDHDRGGHRGGEDRGERHEERHEERR